MSVNYRHAYFTVCSLKLYLIFKMIKELTFLSTGHVPDPHPITQMLPHSLPQPPGQRPSAVLSLTEEGGGWGTEAAH